MKLAQLAGARSVQFVVSDHSRIQRRSDVVYRQNPTAFPRLVWLPVNSDAGSAVDASCLTFRQS